MQKDADEFTLPRSQPVLDATATSGSPVGLTGLAERLAAGLARATDGQVALLLSAVLFLIAAWPIGLVDLPPFQDLPNHLATIAVIQHPERYPEFVFNGYFKTNSALFTWLLLVGNVVGTKAAARLFALIVLALGAL